MKSLENTYIEELVNTKLWDRRILNSYWFFCASTLVLQFINSFFTKYEYLYFIKHYVVIPTILLTAVIGAAEVMVLMFKQYSRIIIIAAANLFTIIIINTHARINNITIVSFLPILIAASYFSKRLILIAAALSELCFVALYFTNPVLHQRTDFTELYATVVILGIGTYLSIIFMNRGRGILKALESTNKVKQELLVKSILMDKMTKMDLLTDLYNHNTFHEYLDELIRQSRGSLIPIQLAVLDIDNFKQINDTYGHRAGDKVIRTISDILKQRVGSNDFVSRYGGEEFAIIFVEKTLNESYEIVESIREQISQISYEELDNKNVTVSIGLQDYKNDGSKENLFKGADSLLYAAKRNGKNQTQVGK